MPRKIIGRPRTQQRVVIEEWSVAFHDPETGELMEFSVFCARGTFFDELPTVLISLGYNPESFTIDGQDRNWWRKPRSEHR